MRLLLLALTLSACDREPLPLPTVAAVADEQVDDAAPTLPLVQVLYANPIGATPDAALQRVRLLLWIRHMELNTTQLDLLEELRRRAAETATRMEAAEAERLRAHAEARGALLAGLWEALASGAALDDPAVLELAGELEALDAEQGGSGGRITRRMEALRSLMDAQQAFLRTLTPAQEAKLNDALFALRHRLDPVAHPGDFEALVGSVYDPGQFAVLTRGAQPGDLEETNIGALWGESGAGLRGHPLHDAKREVILLLTLLEPGLDEAIAAAAVLPDTLARPVLPRQQAPPGPDGRPQPGAPDAPTPGEPDAPQPGAPDAPQPGAPDAPQPGAPDAPPPGAPDAPTPGEPEPPPPGEPDAPQPG